MKPRHEAWIEFGKARARITGTELDTAVKQHRQSTGDTSLQIAEAAGIERATLDNVLSRARRGVRYTAEKATIIGICAVVGVHYKDVAEDVT